MKSCPDGQSKPAALDKSPYHCPLRLLDQFIISNHLFRCWLPFNSLRNARQPGEELSNRAILDRNS